MATPKLRAWGPCLAPVQIDFVAGQQAAADERAAHSEAALEAARTELGRVQQEVGGKDERLAVLEGGCGCGRSGVWGLGAHRLTLRFMCNHAARVRVLACVYMSLRAHACVCVGL